MAQLTRRTLLSAASSLALGAAKTKAQPPAPSKTEPVYPEPGLLAQSRLNPQTVALMTGAKFFWAERRRDLTEVVPQGTPITSPTLGSRRFTFTMPTMPFQTPKPGETEIARRLAHLLLRDELWTEEPMTFYGSKIPFQPDFVFTFADTFPGISAAVCPDAHEIRLSWTRNDPPAASVACTSFLLFDPVGPEMVALIKDAFPGDEKAQALVFVPKPISPPPIASCPPEIAPELWKRITSLKPGMTRGDLEQVFETQGGGSNRLGQTYIQRNWKNNNMGPTHQLIIRAEFVPAGFPLFWRSGRGFLQNLEDTERISAEEMPSDVITYLSPVKWGYFYAGA